MSLQTDSFPFFHEKKDPYFPMKCPCGPYLGCFIIGKLNKTYLQGRRSLVEISSTTSTLRGHTERCAAVSASSLSVFREWGRILTLLTKRAKILSLMKDHVINIGYGWEGVCPLKVLVVDEISTKLRLP